MGFEELYFGFSKKRLEAFKWKLNCCHGSANKVADAADELALISSNSSFIHDEYDRASVPPTILGSLKSDCDEICACLCHPLFLGLFGVLKKKKEEKLISLCSVRYPSPINQNFQF